MKEFDWYGDFGINVFDSDGAYEDLPTTTDKLNNSEHGYFKNHTPGIKRFEHKEYAFKFSSHELIHIDLKEILTIIEKMLVCEEWGILPEHNALRSVKFNGKLKEFNLKDTIKNIGYIHGETGMVDGSIRFMIKRKKDGYERPVFFRRIPWELMRRRRPYVWYPDSGYKPFLDFENMKMRKPTLDEIVNDMSLYTRFSTGFV